MARSNGHKIELTAYDDLFQTDESRAEAKLSKIRDIPIAEIDRMTDGIDVALLGPQVGFQLEKAKKICEPKGIPVAVIPMTDYGMCNGMNVLKFAYQLAKNK